MQKIFNLNQIANDDDSTTPAGCWGSAISSYREDDIWAATGFIDQLRLMGSLDKENADRIKKQMRQGSFDPNSY